MHCNTVHTGTGYIYNIGTGICNHFMFSLLNLILTIILLYFFARCRSYHIPNSIKIFYSCLMATDVLLSLLVIMSKRTYRRYSDESLRKCLEESKEGKITQKKTEQRHKILHSLIKLKL